MPPFPYLLLLLLLCCWPPSPSWLQLRVRRRSAMACRIHNSSMAVSGLQQGATRMNCWCCHHAGMICVWHPSAVCINHLRLLRTLHASNRSCCCRLLFLTQPLSTAPWLGTPETVAFQTAGAAMGARMPHGSLLACAAGVDSTVLLMATMGLGGTARLTCNMSAVCRESCRSTPTERPVRRRCNTTHHSSSSSSSQQAAAAAAAAVAVTVAVL